MEKTNYEFARSLIKIFAFIGVAIGLIIMLAGAAPLFTGVARPLDFVYSMITLLGGLIVAGLSYALYEFFKAFLDLVDNSHVIKQELMSKTKMERS